jgi:carboxymethylenebutenolidase
VNVPGALTDPAAVTGERVQVPVGGDRIEAYLARPTSGGRRPGVIVIHEAFGPNDHIDDLARRFANAGFDALAPNLYARGGAPTPDDMRSVMSKMFGLPDSQAVADLAAAAAYLRSLDSSNGKVGCIGFCSGGRHTLLFAASSNAVDAAVPCWGGFIDKATPEAETTDNRPTPVIDLVGGVQCPVYLVGGAEDENPSPKILAEADDRLKSAGKDVTLEIFDGAGHAFLADYRPSYREGPAFALWPKVVDFFHRHLG